MSKITVLMPVYNGEKYLKEAIDSILKQTYEDYEFLIINDGSTDNTETIIKSYQDRRIVYYKNEQNKGLIYTLNKGLKLAKGEYIARMDADDISLPERFNKQMDFMDTHLNICACCTNAVTINMVGKRISKKWWEKSSIPVEWLILFANPMMHPSMFIRKSFLDMHNFLYDSKSYICEDYDLWTRFTLYSKMARLDDVLLLYRNSKDSVTYSNSKIAQQNSIISNIKLIESLTGEIPSPFHSYLTAFGGVKKDKPEFVKIIVLKNWLDNLSNILADKWEWNKKIKKSVKTDYNRIVISFLGRFQRKSLFKDFLSFRIFGFHFYILLFLNFMRYSTRQITKIIYHKQDGS